MSLLSRRRPLLDPKGKDKDRDEKSLSKRKVQKPRRFKISTTPIDAPILGSNKSSSNGSESFNLLPTSSSLNSARPFPSISSNVSALSSPFSPSTASTSNNTLYSLDRSKLAQEALASSKLDFLASSGPLEAMPLTGRRQIKRNRKHERSLTKGSAWFDMAKAEITKEKKNDLEALKLRSAMDGIFHYKRNNITHTPKYFHVGTVVETSADFYSSRIPKKQRKKSLAQEFASDYGME